jgi:quercetin dioxygenase-like cupin family protein
VVLDGELILRLDDGDTLLRAGDVVIQNGTRHGWFTHGEQPATIAVVMLGLPSSQ